MDAHEREAAGAIAGMSETYGYRPTPGDFVRCERPFRGDFAVGEVVATNGSYVMVELEGERLAYYPHELQHIGRREVAS